MGPKCDRPRRGGRFATLLSSPSFSSPSYYAPCLWASAPQIAKLHQEVGKLEASQKDVDQNLEYIESQQAELETVIAELEKEVKILYTAGPQMLPADEEREK